MPAAGSAAENSLCCHMSTNQSLRSQHVHLHTGFPRCEIHVLSVDSCLVFREGSGNGLGEVAEPEKKDGFVRICYCICTSILDTSDLVAILIRVDFWVSNLETFCLYLSSRLMEELIHCNRGSWFHHQLGFADTSDVSFSEVTVMPPSNLTFKYLCLLSPDGESSLIHAPLFATLIEREISPDDVERLA